MKGDSKAQAMPTQQQSLPNGNRVSLGTNLLNDDPVSWRYALLTKLAALDVELARNATAMGMPASLLFPDET
jgi:hypothetical protein